MSRYGGSHSSSGSPRHDWNGSRDPLEVTPFEIIAMVILTVLLGVVLFGAISQARASAVRNDPTEVASADLNFAAQQVQHQKFLACTATNSEPYILPASALTPMASSDNLAIATNSLPIAQAPSAGTSHPYFARLSAINGVSGFTWSVSPNLPAGLSLSPDGVISGVPRAESSGRYTFTVISNGNSDSKDLSLTVVSVEVLVHDPLLNWTPCQKKSDTTVSTISADSPAVSSTYLNPSPFLRGEEDSSSGVTPPSLSAKSSRVLEAASTHVVKAKRVIGAYGSGDNIKVAKSGNIEQIKLSTSVQGRRITRTITLSN